MDKDKRNMAVGELLCKEKYKFLPHGLVSEIVDDFLEEVKNEK